MMNILHVTFDMRIGGTEMVVKSIIESEASKKFCMSIFCIEKPIGPWGQSMQRSGISVSAHARLPGFDISLIKALRKHIKAHNIDVLHCHQYTPWVYGTIASMGLKCKVIFTEHGRFYPDSTTWKRKLVNPVLAYFTDYFTAISNATKNALSTYEFIRHDKIELIYNGIKPLLTNNNKISLLAALKISDETLILGTIARFDPIKNHTMMLTAFAEVVNTIPNSILVMVGDGDERPNIEKQIVALGLSDNVILTGYQVDPTQYLALMDIFLLSSLSEGTSMTLLEAMSLGKPCVVTDAGGNPEIIQHNYNGFVTKNDNAYEFADAICTMINSNKINEFSTNAKERFHQLFTDQTMVEHYTAIYESAK